MTEKNKLFVIPGMPLEHFPEPLDEQPGSELCTCNHCGNKMWLSKKKRALVLSIPDAFVGCWICILDFSKTGAFEIGDVEQFNI